MKTSLPVRPFRLAAIDLDGTLLGPDHQISQANLAAIAQLQQAGVEITLASGRHFEMIRSFAAELPNLHWIVSVQGAEAASVDRQQVLRRSFLAPNAVAQVAALNQRFNFPMLAYTANRIYALAPGAQRAYAQFFAYEPRLADPAQLAQWEVFKLVWVGEPSQLTALGEVKELTQLAVQTVRSHLHLFEFVQPGVDKASGVSTVAAQVGADAESTIAFGDAENDLPLFRWAGQSVAMPHGWESVKRQATFIAADGPPESAFARSVDFLLNSSKSTDR